MEGLASYSNGKDAVSRLENSTKTLIDCVQSALGPSPPNSNPISFIRKTEADIGRRIDPEKGVRSDVQWMIEGYERDSGTAARRIMRRFENAHAIEERDISRIMRILKGTVGRWNDEAMSMMIDDASYSRMVISKVKDSTDMLVRSINVSMGMLEMLRREEGENCAPTVTVKVPTATARFVKEVGAALAESIKREAAKRGSATDFFINLQTSISDPTVFNQWQLPLQEYVYNPAFARRELINSCVKSYEAATAALAKKIMKLAQKRAIDEEALLYALNRKLERFETSTP